MAEVRSKGSADDDTADESSALLKQRAGTVVPCDVEQISAHEEERLHTTALQRVWLALVNAFSFGNAKNAKRTLITVILGMLTLASGIYLAVSIMTPSTPAPNIPGDIRIVLLADAHLIGPQYKSGSESNDVDNESILKAEHRLREAQRKFEALQPVPAAVVFLGDVIHNGYVSKDFEWYVDNRNAFTVGQEIFSSYKLPVKYLWGNHDYHTVCGNVSSSFDRFELSHRLFQRFFGDDAKEYGILRAGRYKLLFLNGMLGPSWDPTHPRCDTRFASLGEQQLKWLTEQLRGTEPTFVFLHQPLPVTMRSEAPNLHHPDLISLLVANAKQIMAVFSGHYHRGLFWQEAYPFRHYTLPSCRYDSDNWFVLHLPATGNVGSWKLLDWEKNKKRRDEHDLDGDGSRCSETWDYPGGPWGWQIPRRLEPQPPEDGSCGNPTKVEVHSGAPLADLQKADDVPGPTGHQFNPEPACSREYLPAFLDLCLKEGASAGCCAILGQHLRPSSAAYAASCMCWPPFWQEAHRLFRNISATAVEELLSHCETDFKTTSLQWPGRAGGSCMAVGPKGLELPPAGRQQPASGR
ncbi:hypothetical protein VaNZ11_006104 [Volvox africanus]|uniref:Calcineurin-like phosphoesterase domain-containing protein n=1 Tax=Volvox africanus TaxID=51714 RepID=A0ABQ5S024_9CHLO|nr:hypothetical protein VaNZ11_006104 [Volvox africanus]